VLGSLRYLGRGWTFDDIKESTAIALDVHCIFFHCFTEYGSTVLYCKYVLTPVHISKARTHMSEFKEAGLPGCIWSTNCTHITTKRWEYNLKNSHLGPKSSHTTWKFNLTCNHHCRILHSTTGGPGRWNDQTMVRGSGSEFVKFSNAPIPILSVLTCSTSSPFNILKVLRKTIDHNPPVGRDKRDD
jgi:hypothetical protein